jgi:hypothetical protein
VRVAALVLGILGIVLSLVPLMFWLGVPIAIVALVLGILARNAAIGGDRPPGLATAGVVLGTIGIVLGLTMYGVRVALIHTVRSGAQMLKDPHVQEELRKSNQEFNQNFDRAVPNK